MARYYKAQVKQLLAHAALTLTPRGTHKCTVRAAFSDAKFSAQPQIQRLGHYSARAQIRRCHDTKDLRGFIIHI